MKITQNKMVSIHYTLKDVQGDILDSSVGKEPLNYIHGNGYLIAGLENKLEGKEPGDKFNAVIKPADGYGEYDPKLIFKLDRSQLDYEGEIPIGAQFQAISPNGVNIVRVTKVEGDKVTIDANHELAGQILNFDVEVIEVREPTEEELKPRHSFGGCSGNCGNCDGDCGGDCDGECDGNCDCENGGDCNCSK